jgi:hypothetical protein
VDRHRPDHPHTPTLEAHTVTRLAPLWQQNGSYPAQTDRVLVNTLWSASGSTGGAASTVAGTMNVSVAPGVAAVALGAGAANYSALCRWDAAEVVTLTAGPPSGQTRIDLVVLQVRDQVLDAGSNNDFVFNVITGVPAASNPAVPATPANAYPICQVLVPALAANLNSATLTTRRTPLNPRDVFARVYRNAAMTTAAGAAISFDTVQWDTWGCYNPATALFVAPAAGYYRVIGQLAAALPTPGQTVGLTIQVAGAGTASTSQNAGVAGNYWPAVTDVVYATAGQGISINMGGTNGLTAFTGPTSTYMAVEYLHA